MPASASLPPPVADAVRLLRESALDMINGGDRRELVAAAAALEGYWVLIETPSGLRNRFTSLGGALAKVEVAAGTRPTTLMAPSVSDLLLAGFADGLETGSDP